KGLTRNNKSSSIGLGLILCSLCFDSNSNILGNPFTVYFHPLDHDLLILSECRHYRKQECKEYRKKEVQPDHLIFVLVIGFDRVSFRPHMRKQDHVADGV